jgi:hypothetical protein
MSPFTVGLLASLLQELS